VDYGGRQYWSGVINVIAHEETAVDLRLEQLALDITNNPNPVRFDGVPPVREREEKRLAGLEGLVGIVSRTVVGYTSNPKVYYYLNDQLGTPQLMVDSTGMVVWEARYKPFGEAQVHAKSTVVNNFRFPGQYYDQETGLHYNYHRYYDSRTGRYLTPDPIKSKSACNLFTYTDNDPVTKVDPWGLQPTTNGCGPDDWRSLLVPNRPLAYVDFTEACNEHDACYGRCGEKKEFCDKEFHKNMRAICYWEYGYNSVLETPSMYQKKLDVCYALARVYFEAVSRKGQSAYDRGQKCCDK
jgi:RHS repeat-associated protein